MLLLSYLVAGQSGPVRPSAEGILPDRRSRATVSIPKILEAPVIDGKLDEEIWKQAAVFKDFQRVFAGEHNVPSKPTEAYVAYDEKYLYVAFKCWDERDKIRATVTQRDNVFAEDNVRIFLDTYNDQRRAYLLAFNPLGIQQDGNFTEGQGGDYTVDILMESKGLIEDWGWAVEVKIPFKSLRYTAGKGKLWGFNAARLIHRFNNEYNSWSPLPQNIPGYLNKIGAISGLDEIKNEQTIEIIPTLTFKETGQRTSPTEFSNPPIKTDFGFTAKYNITPNITLDAAYNPDFADTEADAPVVEANQRFPIFFEEKRPFFLEGAEIFKTPIQAVYTRQVENPVVALKLTGKVGKNSFGIFGAVDEPLGNQNKNKAYIGVVRLKRDFGRDSNIGFVATNYNFPNQHNTVGGFDVNWRINANTKFIGQVLGSTSRDSFYDPNNNRTTYRTGNGVSFDYDYSHIKQNYSWGFFGNGATRDFRTQLGFTQRTNTIENGFFVTLKAADKPQNFIIAKNLNTNFSVRNDFRGRFQGWKEEAFANFGIRGNLNLEFGVLFGRDTIYEDEFGARRSPTQSGRFFGEAQRSAFNGGFSASLNKTFSKRFSLDSSFGLNFNTFDFDFGAGRKFPRVSPAAAAFGQNAPLDPGTGNGFDFNLKATITPIDKFRFSLGYNKSRLTRNDTDRIAFDSNIFSFRSIYQFSDFVSLKARLDYNTLTGRIFGQYTFGWTPSPGKAFYVGFSDNYNYKGFAFGEPHPNLLQLNRTFFVKMSYLFRKSF